MKRDTEFRLPFGFASILLTFALVLVPHRVLAQHGGGGHGGGGGGHFGGGGGHFAGFGFGRSHSSKAATPSGSKPSTESAPPTARPSIESTAPNSEFAPFSPAPAHTTIGFPPSEQPTSFPGLPLHTGQSAGPLSFSGEGHLIWQNPRAAGTSSHGQPTPPPAMMRPQPPHIVRPPFFPPYYPSAFFGFYGYGPFLGFGWGCSPFDPWPFACGGFGYGAYGFGLGGYYPPAGDYDQPPAPDDTSSEPSPSTWQNPPAAEDLENNGGVPTPRTLIYLRDGSSYEVTDYWFADNKLHYVTNYGGENSVDLRQIDVQRTVDANAARGTDFTLHPAPPAGLTPPPSADSAPPQ
jgi:hypothetical protein